MHPPGIVAAWPSAPKCVPRRQVAGVGELETSAVERISALTDAGTGKADGR